MKEGTPPFIIALGFALMLTSYFIGESVESRKHRVFFNRGFETGSMATYLSIQKDVAQGKFPETMAQALVNAREQYSKMGGSLSTNR